MSQNKDAMEKAASEYSKYDENNETLHPFISGWQAAHSGPKVLALVEAANDLLDKLKRVERELKDVSLQMARLHNDDTPENTAEHLRCRMLVLAADIGYQFDAVNAWNLKPAKDKMLSALADFEGGKDGT